MRRYFFHLCDGDRRDLVKDFDGALFAGLCEAKQEAIGLGQDIVSHGIHQATWQIVVTCENGDCAFIVPLVEIRQCKARAWLDFARRIITYEPRFRSQLFTWLLVATVLAIIMQAALLRHMERPENDYHLASVPTNAAIIDIQFAPRTSVTDMSKFFTAYQASLVSCSLPDGWYCLRLSELTMPRKELETIISKMKRENIVSSVAFSYNGDTR